MIIQAILGMLAIALIPFSLLVCRKCCEGITQTRLIGAYSQQSGASNDGK